MLAKIIDNASIGVGSEGATDSVDLSLCSSWAVQFVWTGDAEATLSVQASLDNVNFSEITDASTTMGGADGSYLFNGANLASFPYIRMAISDIVSGSSTLTILVSGKEN